MPPCETHPPARDCNVFIPFIRDELSDDFEPYLIDLLSVLGDVEQISIHAKMKNGRLVHYYAFMYIEPASDTKAGRDLYKNLRSGVSTFFYGCAEGYLELKPYLNKQQRIERGYSGVTLYTKGDDATTAARDDATTAARDDATRDDAASGETLEDDFSALLREIDDERNLYSLWKPSVYLTV
jgi:hypothetical protein